MPSTRRRRQQSPSVGSGSSTSTIPATLPHKELSLKELSLLVPAFSSPAHIWASKIKLLWPSTETAPTSLCDVIRLRLPTTLYELTYDITFTSHVTLLEKICALDGPSPLAASQILLESKSCLRPEQSPRELLTEFKRLARTAFPSYTTEQVSSLAWNKLLIALPVTLQQTLALLPHRDPTDENLEALDRVWKLQSVQPSVSAVTRSESTTEKLLHEISSQLLSLTEQLRTCTPHVGEVSALRHAPRHAQPPDRPHVGGLCWYHARFGNEAQRCVHPCNFVSQSTGKAKRAPSQ